MILARLTRFRGWSGVRVASVTFLFSVISAACNPSLSVQEQSQALQVTTSGELRVPSRRIDLGKISQGGRIEATTTLANTTDKHVKIADLTRSCPCITLDVLGKEITPGQVLQVHVIVDMTDDPRFVGGLGLEVKLMDEEGMRFCDLVFLIDVLSRS